MVENTKVVWILLRVACLLIKSELTILNASLGQKLKCKQGQKGFSYRIVALTFEGGRAFDTETLSNQKAGDVVRRQ